MLLEAAPSGVFELDFAAVSASWQVGTLPGGGSMHPRDPEYTYFSGDGRKLKDAFLGRGPDLWLDALARHDLTWSDFAVVAVHQVTMPYLETLRAILGIPADKLVVTLPEHGNVASATLALQLASAVSAGRLTSGDKVAFVGLAGGVSLGVMFSDWI